MIQPIVAAEQLPTQHYRWRNAHLLVVVCLLLVGASWFLYRRVDRGPHDGPFPQIIQEHYVCDQCGSLDGGIYGKGPHKRLRTDAGGWCIHVWRLIDRTEFKRQATERFGVDWSQEIPFWSAGGTARLR